MVCKLQLDGHLTQIRAATDFRAVGISMAAIY